MLSHQAVMLAKCCQPDENLQDQNSQETVQSNFMAQHVVTLHDMQLPELDENRQIVKQKVLVFNNDSC